MRYLTFHFFTQAQNNMLAKNVQNADAAKPPRPGRIPMQPTESLNRCMMEMGKLQQIKCGSRGDIPRFLMRRIEKNSLFSECFSQDRPILEKSKPCLQDFWMVERRETL